MRADIKGGPSVLVRQESTFSTFSRKYYVPGQNPVVTLREQSATLSSRASLQRLGYLTAFFGAVGLTTAYLGHVGIEGLLNISNPDFYKVGLADTAAIAAGRWAIAAKRTTDMQLQEVNTLLNGALEGGIRRRAASLEAPSEPK